MTSINSDSIRNFVSPIWHNDVIPKLEDYIRIPNVSPMFLTDETKAQATVEQDRAMKLILDWVSDQDVKGINVELICERNRTPLLFIEVCQTEGVNLDDVGTILMYGHMDKQPPFTGWENGLSPYEPVIKNGRLYGRGGADDGYSCFTAITSIRAVQQQGLSHGRIVLIIEACEESGSPDLPHYVTAYKDRIGEPNLVICLDSGCGNYDQMWMTSSLRGVVNGKLTVEVLSEGVHSGDASGIVPDTFRLARKLLNRIENPDTGEVIFDALRTNIPEKIKEQVASAAKILGDDGVFACFPFLSNCEPTEVPGNFGDDRLTQLALNRWWRAQLTVTGASGLPSLESAGNVLRPSTSLALSLRLPPNLPTEGLVEVLKNEMTRDPPNGAHVTFSLEDVGTGWAASAIAPWLESAINEASRCFYDKDMCVLGEGGSIPFMAMLGELFPRAQFLVTGVLGPHSNAHGPNEFLDIEYSNKLTMCIAYVLGKHCICKVEALAQTEESPGQSKKQKVSSFLGRLPDGTKA